MKNFQIINILFFASIFQLQAQFNLSKNGNVGIGSTPDIYYKLYSTAYNLADYNIAVQGDAESTSSEGWCKGVCGSATGNYCNFGVQGFAMGSSTGKNFGVIGQLFGTTKGAAIYGSVEPYNLPESINGSYAEYFNGNVYIKDKLNVGSVGIGTAPISPYSLTVGHTRFHNGMYNGLIIAGVANYSLCLYPTANNTGCIGLSNKAFTEMYCYNYYDLNSDLKQKENIRSLFNTLDIIKNLRGIKYDLKQSFSLDSAITDSKIRSELIHRGKNRIGFIAQEMIKVLPEAVHYVDSTDVYAIDYTRVIPVLVEAMKEQQFLIEKFQSELTALKNSPKEFKENLVTKSESLQMNQLNLLYQNSPNPFNRDTEIKYTLNDHISSAMICIYDLNGTQLKCYRLLPTKGDGSITVSANEIKPGMFIYSLLADGSLVDSKKMIITE